MIALAIITSMIPPSDSSNPALFLLKVVGGSALLIGIGLLFYRHGQRTIRGAALADS